MEYYLKSYWDIVLIDKNGIVFENGGKINFDDCINQRYDSPTCVAERDITAVPPYFEFFTSDKPTRIVFNKKGFFSKNINKKNFIKFQMQINDKGYSTYDLS